MHWISRNADKNPKQTQRSGYHLVTLPQVEQLRLRQAEVPAREGGEADRHQPPGPLS